MNKTIHNPIIPGFSPDPSIIRVGSDYYIATSTFEWFPGCQIHHSRDLRSWSLVGRPLNRSSQLDMKGVPDSCGVWAPCLSYNATTQTYYLVYSNVRSFDGVWKDTPNYLVTTKDILGEWSDPVYLNSSGFDASLFHDIDGRMWMLNMIVDHRKGLFFGGIVLQEYDPQTQKLVGESFNIFSGSELGKTEGPHLYQRNGYYYLLTAEGGTEYGHAITLCRSRRITGPFELHPTNPLLSARENPDLYLQKTGHGDLFQTKDGQWYVTFHSGRPLSRLGRCTLGRESCLEKIIWSDDDWPYLEQGGMEPRTLVPAPELPDQPTPGADSRLDFQNNKLDIHFQSLRIPITEDWANLKARLGFLRLFGRESLSSLFEQSLLARRVQSHHIQVSVCMEFSPYSYQQMAGLVCYYNTYHYHYLHVAGGGTLGSKRLGVITCDKHNMFEPIGEGIDISSFEKIYLRVDFEAANLQFSYSQDAHNWKTIGPILDGSILSDDYVRDEDTRYRPAFTGAFVGICCQDLGGNRNHADFEWFTYKHIK